jgi:hypothetical protein
MNKTGTLQFGQNSFLATRYISFPQIKKALQLLKHFSFFLLVKKNYDLTNFPFLSLGILDFTIDFVCKSSNIFKASST